jgi:phosphopantetheinyl transferase (holo-ACP synthase)
MIADDCWALVTSSVAWSPAEQHDVGRQGLLGLLMTMCDIKTGSVAGGSVAMDQRLTFDGLRILPEPGKARRRPWAFQRDGKPLRRYLSVAHLPTAVVVAAASRRIGIDLVDLRTELGSGFSAHWFNAAEAERLSPLPIQIGWAAKEATYKAICRRKPFRPRQLTILSVHHAQPDDATVMLVVEESLAKTSRRAIVTILYREPFAIALATAEPRNAAEPAAAVKLCQLPAFCETARPTGCTAYWATEPNWRPTQSRAPTPSTTRND